MKTIINALVFICFLPANSFSQVNQEWVSTYNGLGTALSLDKSHAIDIDLSGNIYVTGESYGIANNLDYLTIKINSAGDTLWTRRYNGTADSSDVATDITVDHLGNVYVTGRSFGAGTNWDYVTIKYSTMGDVEWVARYSGVHPIPGGMTQDIARSICVDDFGNCYVTGVSTLQNMDDILTIKYNSLGNEVWVDRYNGPLSVSDQAYKVRVDGLGNAYVVGFVDGSGAFGTRDYCTIKYDSAGVRKWLARYDGLDHKMDEARLLDIDGSGNIYVSGISTSNLTYIDFLTIKYDSAGIEQWTARYSYSSLAKEDFPKDMVVDAVGNCYITGMSRSDQNWAGFSTFKYDSSGVQLWTSRYDHSNSEVPNGIAMDGQGNVYVSGESNGDGYTIAYNSLGSEIWNSRFTNPGLSTESVSDIVVDAFSEGSPKVYVSGSSENASQDANYIILKYSSLTGISDSNPGMVKSFNLSQNYPNPFNPSTKISWQSPISGHQSLKVYDVLGNEVATLVDEYREAGKYEVDFNASQLSSGIYFYKLLSAAFVSTKKMILMK